MNTVARRVIARLLAAVITIVGCISVSGAESIRQILEQNCLECHHGQSAKAELDLSERAGFLRGGESGQPSVIPGDLEKSLLYRKITHQHKPGMPLRRPKLSDADVEALAAWIKSGAPLDGTLRPEKGAAKEEIWWSLEPLRRPPIPGGTSLNPIDRFVHAKLKEKGLQPSLPAEKSVLLRRIYFDLIGLPPRPEEMEQFLSDGAPDAYEAVVDRLLASPRYGERWARHWLDVVHYAETHGHDQDRVRTNAWPYRDYVIRSFNQDKSYPRFIEEQIAGDALFPDNAEALVAMGFLATGPWDESSLRDIQEDTVDRKVARYLDRDDIVTTVMNTFASTTVQCARCHDHKFDPVSQEEYYGLQAVFAATDKANRLYDPDPAVARKRRELAQRKKAIERQEPKLAETFQQASFGAELAKWEKSLRERTAAWTILQPATFISSNGATLTRQNDGSVLSSGTRPETDTYVIHAESALPGITGFRLEVLADESLPHKGPGRQDNGNLHLTTFQAQAALPGQTNQILRLANAKADFDQAGWGIEKAIDGDPKSAWGIYPAVGRSHQAVFELGDKLTNAGPALFTFTLAQNHGGGHLIGRIRLAVTTSAPPLSVSVLPDQITQILRKPQEERDAAEIFTLSLHYLGERTDKELAALPKQHAVYAGASDYPPDGTFKPAGKPRPVHVLKRGDINRPGPEATPAALSCVSQLPSRLKISDLGNEGERRLTLARWLAHPENPLTWRSIVNRIWHYHFGRGIVDSPNDFGRMGGTPSHLELLNWLATEFRDAGGSIKTLHKLIVTSETYRRSSQHNPGPAALDAGNVYLWRMHRTRLDAESVRDAILHITGKLDWTMGGPSVQQFVLSPGIHVTPVVDYTKFDVDSAASYRRSIYRFIFRTLPDPFMDTLDCADASQLTAARNTSVTALQALAMLNDHFVVRQAEHFASRLAAEQPEVREQIVRAYRLALCRAPSPDELDDSTAYTQAHGLANFCRVLLNSNEFMFVN